MSENINSAQTIFTIFFALYYAFTIGTTGKLKLFDTSAMCNPKKYPKSWLRFLLGFIFINILPLLYFWCVLNKLEIISGNNAYKNFGVILIIFLQSLIGFGFYRILFGLLMIKRKGTFFFYDNVLYLDQEGSPIEQELSLRKEPDYLEKNHILPGAIWIIVISHLLILIL